MITRISQFLSGCFLADALAHKDGDVGYFQKFPFFKTFSEKDKLSETQNSVMIVFSAAV